MRARIYKSAKRDFDCKIMDADKLVSACAHGNLLKGKESLVVGDYVELEQNEQGEYLITGREERENEIFRVIVREQKKKVTAANCDHMVIVTSVSKPEFKRGIVDRYLIRAFQWGIYPLVIFNKMDEHKREEVDIKFEQQRLQAAGVRCFEMTAKNADYRPLYLTESLAELKQTLNNKTSIFLGQSGVGKSKIISQVCDGDVYLKSNSIGKSGKGAHTTTWSEIVDCDSLQLIDSPGIRSFSVEDILPAELIELFPDLELIANQCKFRNCAHGEGIKGCAFWTNQRGELENKYVLSRLESYRKILEEISQTPGWNKI